MPVSTRVCRNSAASRQDFHHCGTEYRLPVAARFPWCWLERKTIDLIELALLPNRPMVLEQIELASIHQLKPLRQPPEQDVVLREAHCS